MFNLKNEPGQICEDPTLIALKNIRALPGLTGRSFGEMMLSLSLLSIS